MVSHRQTISVEFVLRHPRHLGQKQEDAEDKVNRLCDLVQQTLESNLLLAQRLVAFEITHAQASGQAVPGGVALTSSCMSKDLASVLDHDSESSHISDCVWRQNPHDSAFEKLLVISRAYRNAPLDNSDAFSAISSAR